MASDKIKELALTVRAACKRYTSQVVLRGLDMTVHRGCIYGLLGPSGCGKTTLFKCIVGRQHLDSGEIFLRSREKHDLGYMPQELSLYNDFSIEEVLAYYGMLYGMSSEAIARRTSELVCIFSLPPPQRIIKQLSGGQKRRVSFSLALLHNPTLLILDEPTVGMDPLLCHTLWKYMLHLTTNEKKTIVITTHYIEEARQADVIGLMREGVLLAEESPQALMDSHHCDSLEQVFLRLSRTQTDTKSTKNTEEARWYSLPLKKIESPLNETCYPRPYRVKAQIVKTINWMLRNIPIMVFIICLPIVESTLFNVCIGKDPLDLRLGYISEEITEGVDHCNSVPLSGCHLHTYLSCRYIKTLENKRMILTEFNSIEDGMSAVRRNDVWGLIHFPRNYTKNYNIRLARWTRASGEDIDLSEVNVWMDMSDQIIGNMIKRDLYAGFIDFQRSLFQDCDWPVAAAGIPVNFKEAIYGSNKLIFTQYGAPAIATIVLFYMPLLFTVAALLMEKTEGLLDRNMTAGLNLSELLISHVFVQLLINAVHIIIVMTINFAIFDFPMVGNWFLFTCLCFVVGVCGMSYGLLMASVCSSDIQATVMGLGTFFPLTMVTGMIWPVEGMHYTLRSVAFLIPLTQSTEAYRAITARAWHIDHPAVYSGFLSCILWTIVFLLLSAAMVKWSNGTGSKH